MTKKKKHTRPRQQNPTESLRRLLQKDGWTTKYRPATLDVTGHKISEVFLEFIEPFRPYADTAAAYEKLVVTGIIAWNTAQLTGTERQTYLSNAIQIIIDQTGETWRKSTEDVLAMLIKHKERSFATDPRFIVEYQLTDTGRAYHLAMAALE